MKLTYKLVLGFLSTSLAVGAVGLLAIRQGFNVQSKWIAEQQSSMEETRNALEVNIEISRLASLNYNVLNSQAQASQITTKLERLHQSEAEINATIRKIQNGLKVAKVYYQANLKARNVLTQLGSDESKSLKRIETLQNKFNDYADRISQFLRYLSVAEYSQASTYLEQNIESYRKYEILPLLSQYQDELGGRTLTQNIAGDWVTASISQYIATITFIAVLLGMSIGGYIAYSIYYAISQLEKAAIAVGKGNLNFFVELKSKDEFGLLAQSFNQMITDLSQITVSKSYLDNILDSISESLVVLNFDGTLGKVNRATQELLGYDESELIGQTIDKILSVSNLVLDTQRIDGLSLDHLLSRGDVFYRCKSGQKIPVACSISPIQDGGSVNQGIILVARDITELKQAQDNLLHNATHDALTNLPNRVFFQDRITQLLSRAHQDPSYLFAILFLDLDRFKLVNDSLGHLAGDQLLIGIAQRVKTCIRKQDIMARLGGDEFAILLDDIESLDEVKEVAQRIQEQLAFPFHLVGQEVFSSTSIGITLSSHGYQTLDEMVRDADTAMYQAKQMGKARYAIFDQTMQLQSMKRLQLENDLRRAIARQEIQLLYQPIVHLKTRQVVGFEALVRWYHPEWGLILPSEFIPIAEETNLIAPLGHWILATVCQQLKHWSQLRPTVRPEFISVNLSIRQLQEPDFGTQVTQIIRQTQVVPSSIKLEITESVLEQGFKDITSNLSQLQASGLKFAIDDFGTGYSSLARLHRYPIDTLKIDKVFVEGIDQESDKAEMVRVIVHLAATLRLSAIAEGIETPQQLNLLRDLGCTYGQGHLFSTPIPATDATVMLHQGLLFESGEIARD